MTRRSNFHHSRAGCNAKHRPVWFEFTVLGLLVRSEYLVKGRISFGMGGDHLCSQISNASGGLRDAGAVIVLDCGVQRVMRCFHTLMPIGLGIASMAKDGECLLLLCSTQRQHRS